jgi:hypothetical protein
MMTRKSIYEMSMYEIDERDAAKLCRGFQAAIDWMRKNGTLPPRAVSKAKKAAAESANDNELPH